jgi:hypothetical protein
MLAGTPLSLASIISGFVRVRNARLLHIQVGDIQTAMPDLEVGPVLRISVHQRLLYYSKPSIALSSNQPDRDR